MNLSKYLLLGLGILSLQSCDDSLGNKPKGYTIPEKLEDYSKLLNSSYLMSSSNTVLSYLTDDIYRTSDGEIMNVSSEGNPVEYTEFNLSGCSDQERNLYTFKSGQVLTAGNNDPLWDDAYANIYVYNAVANNILNVPDGTKEQREAKYAEALVGRAFEYLNLVNIFGNHYDPATAATDYGVPILLSEEVGDGASYVRNTVAEVYNQIMSDLKTATPLLPEVATNVYHPNRTIGYAFQARMFLYMGDYENALTNANEALKLNDQLLDMKPYTTTYSTFGRIVLASNPDETFPEDVSNVENIFMRNLGGAGSGFYRAVVASKDLLETFKSHLAPDGEDMRLSLFFATDEANFTMNPSSEPEHFKGYSTYAPYINQNAGFTTPEIYLIAAECEARIGSISRALQLLDKLRDARIKNNVHYVEATDAPNRTEALRLVIDERRREFALQGAPRLIDLKRLNREDWFRKDIVHSANGETWTLPANDPRYIMPVPQTVLDFNPDMPQYDR